MSPPSFTLYGPVPIFSSVLVELMFDTVTLPIAPINWCFFWLIFENFSCFFITTSQENIFIKSEKYFTPSKYALETEKLSGLISGMSFFMSFFMSYVVFYVVFYVGRHGYPSILLVPFDLFINIYKSGTISSDLPNCKMNS